MKVEVFCIKDERQREHIKANARIYPQGNLGQYLRICSDIYFSRAVADFTPLLETAGVSREQFLELFTAGDADACSYSYIDAQRYNFDLREQGHKQGYRVYPSFLLEKSVLKLAGRAVDLWDQDNEDALRGSVEAFQKAFPDIQVVAGKVQILGMR